MKQKASTLIILLVLILAAGCGNKDQTQTPVLDQNKLAAEYFNEDSAWFLANIPFFECSDKEIEQVYYYRWKMYKAHIRNVGPNAHVITEFINHVAWDRSPFCTINAATMHHIHEGRWLKDPRYMNGYIDNMFQHGGNNRSYSESVADAAYARFLVNADTAFLVSQLDSMKAIYNRWNDHWDPTKNLYYIPAMPDATEYTIAHIDGAGGKPADLNGGEAFRPTINSYMYANALAISRIAAMKGDMSTSNDYLRKANALKTTIEQHLWNDSLQHFTDRYQMNNQYVHYWDFIRGRELAGMIPWYFSLPADNSKFNAAWKHVMDTNHLLGQYGLRTNEPSYEYYFKQYVFYEGQRGSQWNGPNWPYQSSQTITAMANFLNDYKQPVITNADYMKQLRLYTKQHYLPDGRINLVENYDPNLGGPIVYYYWSNHYNHSSYNDLIIAGLCGIRPSASDTLYINPLIDTTIKYFALADVSYHGHKLTIVYDADGTKYKLSKGLTVFIDGKKAKLIKNGARYKVVVGKAIIIQPGKQPENIALNILKKGFPEVSASVNTIPDTMYQAVDGREWYFTEITNQWTTTGSASQHDWYTVDFGKPHDLSSVKIYLSADGKRFGLPDSLTIDHYDGNNWIPVKVNAQPKLKANTGSTLLFDKITASRIRLNFKHTKLQVALVEVECY